MKDFDMSPDCQRMEAGSEVKLTIVNKNDNANDDLCLTGVFLSVSEHLGKYLKMGVLGDKKHTLKVLIYSSIETYE